MLHRDTFFRALKFWFFLRPVQREDGPFEYVPGSHRLDAISTALGAGHGHRCR